MTDAGRIAALTAAIDREFGHLTEDQNLTGPYLVARMKETIRRALSSTGSAEADPWRPIETAPRDGTSILLSDGAWCCEGFWDQLDFDPYDMRSPRGMPVMGWNYGPAEIDESNWTPTLWAPLLPEPTSALQAQEGRSDAE